MKNQLRIALCLSTLALAAGVILGCGGGGNDEGSRTPPADAREQTERAATDAGHDVAEAATGVKEAAQEAVDAASEAVEETTENVVDAASNAVDEATQAADDAVGEVTDAAEQVVDTASDTASDAADAMTQAAEDAVETATEVVDDAAGAVSDAIEEVTTNATSEVIEVAATKPGLTRIGVKKCKMCHKVQHASWAEGAHASLDPPLDCESCHGPGSEYKSKKVMEDPAAARAAGLVVPDKSFCDNCHADDWKEDMLEAAHAHEEETEGN